MKVAHTAVVTPHLAGLYETARDLVAAERRAGIDARIVDPVNKDLDLVDDRGVPIARPDFVKECDVIVSHSGLSAWMNEISKAGPIPVVHVMHGRPESSFILEQQGKINVYTYLRTIAGDGRFKGFVTFWPSAVAYWSLLLPEEKIRVIPPPVDLEQWTPDGPNGYKFGGHKGRYNVVCASVWREDESPYHILHAAYCLAVGYAEPGTMKVHVYAAPEKGSAWRVLKDGLREAGCLGEVKPFVRGLANVYRAADVAITPHRIATRSVREPLACGCNVVMGLADYHYTPFQADPKDLVGYGTMIARAVHTKCDDPRMRAEAWFDPKESARQMIELLEEVLDG